MNALSKSQGADPTLAAQYGSSAVRNGEPFGELGMVRQGDAAMGVGLSPVSAWWSMFL